MSFWNRIFGKKVSTSRNPNVVDLRDDVSRKAERRAQSSLSGNDEEIARRLITLLSKSSDGVFSNLPEEVQREIRDIGRGLSENSGFSRMQTVGYRVANLSDHGRLLEWGWNGIGEWMA